MRKKIFLSAVIILIVTSVLFIMHQKLTILILPLGAIMTAEQLDVRLYETRDDRGEIKEVYLIDRNRILTRISVSYGTRFDILGVRPETVFLFEQATEGNFPGTFGNIYAVNRVDGFARELRHQISHFFTTPDYVYGFAKEQMVIGDGWFSSVELTDFVDRDIVYAVGSELPIRAMSLSPDAKKIFVIAEKTHGRENVPLEVAALAYAQVFIIDLEQTPQNQQLTPIFTFTESWQEGPFTPFLGIITTWGPDSQATIIDDDGTEHIITF